jgi:AraC-like DNA-binding protein
MSAAPATRIPAGPLARYEDFSHSDIGAVEAHLNRFIIPHRLVSPARQPRGRFRHGRVDFGDFTLSSVCYDFDSGQLEVRAPAMDDDYRIQVTLSGRGCVDSGANGLAFGPSGFVIIHPNRPFHESFDSRCHHLLLTLRREALERAYFNLTGRPPRERVRFTASVVDMTGQGEAFISRLAALCGSLDSRAFRSAWGSPRRSGGEALLHAALLSLPHNHSEDLRRAPGALTPDYVRRIEEYIIAHAREDVTMGDLVRTAGCSARSVYHSFRRYQGVSPMRFLRDYRLALSRDELLEAGRTGRTVTDAASACGFTHMSKFTALYKARFGETPSETRKRGMQA